VPPPRQPWPTDETRRQLRSLVRAVAESTGTIDRSTIDLARALQGALFLWDGGEGEEDEEEDEEEDDGEVGSEEDAGDGDDFASQDSFDFSTFMSGMHGLFANYAAVGLQGPTSMTPPGLGAGGGGGGCGGCGGCVDDLFSTAIAAAAAAPSSSASAALSSGASSLPQLEAQKGLAAQEQKKKVSAVKKIFEQEATTIMIRNLPPSMQTEDVTRMLQSYGFAGVFDLCRVPRDFSTGRGKGMAFVNFKSVQHSCLFAWHFHGFNGYDIAPATHQGRDANYDKWRRKHKNVKDKKMKPWTGV